MEQQQADALALVAETALHHGIDPGAPGERYQVVVHVEARYSRMPMRRVNLCSRMACTFPRERPSALRAMHPRGQRHAADGRIEEVGARTRTIPPAVTAALHHRESRLSLPPGLRAAVRPGPSHPPLGARRPHHTLESGIALSSSTTARCTKRATRLSDRPTESFASPGRTGGRCPTPRLRRLCGPIRRRVTSRQRWTRASPPRAHGDAGLARREAGRWLRGSDRLAPTGRYQPRASSTQRRPPRADCPTWREAAEA